MPVQPPAKIIAAHLFTVLIDDVFFNHFQTVLADGFAKNLICDRVICPKGNVSRSPAAAAHARRSTASKAYRRRGPLQRGLTHSCPLDLGCIAWRTRSPQPATRR